VLSAGRLSFHAKAHLLAMYQALQAAIPSPPKGQKLLLIELGWFGNEPIANAFKQSAQWASPALQVKHLDGREASVRQLAWASADLFCSLSDNLQETFWNYPH
jgi:starch synthase